MRTPWRDFGRSICPRTIARRTEIAGSVALVDVLPLERDRLGDPQARAGQQPEQQRVPRRRLLQQPPKLLAAQGAHGLVLVHRGLPRRQLQLGRRVVAHQALGDRRTVHRPDRDDGVGDRGVRAGACPARGRRPARRRTWRSRAASRRPASAAARSRPARSSPTTSGTRRGCSRGIRGGRCRGSARPRRARSRAGSSSCSAAPRRGDVRGTAAFHSRAAVMVGKDRLRWRPRAS